MEFDQMRSDSSSEPSEARLRSGGRLHEWDHDNVALFQHAAAQILLCVTSTGYKRTIDGRVDVYVHEEFPQLKKGAEKFIYYSFGQL